MADKRNRILPTVYRTGDPVIDRNLDAIHEAFRRLSSANDDDHEVKADAADTGHASLREKLKDTATLVWSTETTAGVRRVKGDVQGIPAPDDHKVGVSAGDIAAGKWGPLASKARGDNITITAAVQTDPTLGEQVVFSAVPPTPPVVQGSKLYPSLVPDSANRGSVTCIFCSPGTGEWAHIFYGEWTETSTGSGVWERSTSGPLTSSYLDGVSPDAYNTSGISVMLGKTVLAYSPETVPDPENACLFIVEDVGGHYENYGTPEQTFVSTKARLRRAPGYTQSANFVVGMTFAVQSGDTYIGQYFTLTAAVPPTWSHSGTHEWSDKHELLTAAQLTTEGAASTTETVTWSAISGTEDATFPFVTIAGTPGVTSIPAGPQLFAIESIRLTTADLSGVTSLKIKIDVMGENGTTEIGTAFTAEALLTPNVPAVPLSLQYDLIADVTWSAPTYRLRLTYQITTTCSSSATIELRYSSSSRGTWWQSTMQFAGLAGTLDHQLLTMSSRGFAVGQEAAATRSRHPRRAIESFSAAPTSLSGGDLVPDSTADVIVISSYTTVSRINTSQWPGGVARLTLFFPLGGILDQSVGGSGDLAKLDLGNFGGLSSSLASTLELGTTASAELLLLGGAWHLLWYNAGTVTVPP